VPPITSVCVVVATPPVSEPAVVAPPLAEVVPVPPLEIVAPVPEGSPPQPAATRRTTRLEASERIP
jgi:hypothetical protein